MNPQYYSRSGQWACTNTATGDKILYDMSVKPVNNNSAPINGVANGANGVNGANGANGSNGKMVANNGVPSDSEDFTITPFQAEAVEEATIYSQAQNNLTTSALVGNRVRGYNPDSGDWNGPIWAGPESSVPGSYNDDLPESLTGTDQLWFRAELYSYGDGAPDGGVYTNTAQLCRWAEGSTSITFQLDVGFVEP